MIFFGAIYMGTYAISMRVFEIKKRSEPIRVESVNIPIAIEEEIIDHRFLSAVTMDRICHYINEFLTIINSYKCDDVKMYANPAFFRMADAVFIKDSIKRRCGLNIIILSNSEHRLMTYEKLTEYEVFSQMIEDSCGVVNIGGGDTQLTIAKKGELCYTEHIALGAVLLYDAVKNIPQNTRKKRQIMTELVDKQLMVVRSRMSEKKLSSLIIMGDFAREALIKTGEVKESVIDAKKFLKHLDEALSMSDSELSSYLSVPDENIELLAPYMVMYKRIVEVLEVKRLFVPALDILDGIAYDYALGKNLIKPARDFGEDVLSAARYMAARYLGYSPHIEALVESSTLIFEAMKPEHDMGERELLMLKCAAILHDIGKFVALTGSAAIASDIIMASEILGLSHEERTMVANIVKYNSLPLVRKADSNLSDENYLIVSRCAAIMRLANVIDRSHRQKFKKITAKLTSEKTLVITVTSEDDLLLEKSMFDQKTDVFENVFSIKPVLRHKKV